MLNSPVLIPSIDFQLIADSTRSTSGEDVHDNCQEAQIYQAALELAVLEVEDAVIECRAVNESYIREKVALAEEQARRLQARIVKMRLSQLHRYTWALGVA